MHDMMNVALLTKQLLRVGLTAVAKTSKLNNT